MNRKITVVGGAGNVGATVARGVADKQLADVVILDIADQKAAGVALDILEAWGSDVVVITSGVPRKPGMSRDDLLNVNYGIMQKVTEQVVRYSPDCIIIPVANPLDAMAQAIYRLSKFPRERVIGMAGHGDTMVPLPRYSTVAGIPITDLMDKTTIERIVARTAGGGAEITQLVGTSAWYAPGASVVEMVEAILLDKHKILPCSVFLQGEYGVRDLFVGVPVKIGARGLEKIIEIKLTPDEEAAFRKSAAAVKELVDVIKV